VNIGIIGYGVVGKAVHALFSKSLSNQVHVYDKFVAPYNSDECRKSVNGCDIAFVAVPTPTSEDGLSCDTRAVEEAVEQFPLPLCVKSTVVPGTIQRLTREMGRPIAFSPEYVGETVWHPWRRIESHGFLIVGGPRKITDLVVRAYQSCLGPETHYYQTDALTAEVCKYMENCFLATKVAFVNQFYDISTMLGINFNELRELWLADERIGRSHTIVTEERGFRGRCLPKDVRAMIALMRQHGGAPFLEAMYEYNKEVCRKADEARAAKKVTSA
jgi:UDPglucose 6-dehydrogenase